VEGGIVSGRGRHLGLLAFLRDIFVRAEIFANFPIGYELKDFGSSRVYAISSRSSVGHFAGYLDSLKEQKNNRDVKFIR